MTAVNIPDWRTASTAKMQPSTYDAAKTMLSSLSPGAGVVGEADGGQSDREQHRTPPRNTRDIGVRRAMVGRDRRPRALS